LLPCAQDAADEGEKRAASRHVDGLNSFPTMIVLLLCRSLVPRKKRRGRARLKLLARFDPMSRGANRPVLVPLTLQFSMITALVAEQRIDRRLTISKVANSESVEHFYMNISISLRTVSAGRIHVPKGPSNKATRRPTVSRQPISDTRACHQQ